MSATFAGAVNTILNETQILTLPVGTANGSTFTMTLNGVTTAAITYNNTAPATTAANASGYSEVIE